MAKEKSFTRKQIEKRIKNKIALWVTGTLGFTGGAILLVALCVLLIIMAFVPIFGAISADEQQKAEASQTVVGANLPQEVLRYKEDVLAEMKTQGLKEFHIDILLAIMAQESGGRVTDVFQASESLGKPPNSIGTSESIKQGVKYYGELVKAVGMTDKFDLDKTKLILQSYNFGSGFIDYAKRMNDGKYSKQLAKNFSATQASNMGWSSYGDVNYVDNVMKYLNSGNSSIDELTGNFKKPNTSSYSNPYLFGQCTWYVAGRRAEIGAKVPNNLGDAWMWVGNAKSQGIKVNNTPKAGTAVVWQRNQFGSDSYYGHVGFVEEVKSNGDIIVSEMNVKGLNVLSYRTIPASQANSLSYIY